MKNYLTLILNAAVVVAGIVMLTIDVAVTWWVFEVLKRNASHTVILIVLILGIYTFTALLLMALFQASRLLNNIKTNKAFSEHSINSLKRIFHCFAGIFLVSVMAGLPFFYYWAELDDAPGVFVIGLILCGIAFIITVFALLLQSLWQEALNAKSENDLTI